VRKSTRRKLRCIMWRQWKRQKTRYRELVSRGLDPEQAQKSANTGKGPWRNSKSRHMGLAAPNAFFSELGLVSLLDGYLRANRSL
jgi:RNA-directed DNA polymerase